jgi:predicted RNA binding protein YcfA (HicA-like mRNA interferase family)
MSLQTIIISKKEHQIYLINKIIVLYMISLAQNIRELDGINQIKKLEKMFRQTPVRKDLTFADDKRLLEHYGYRVINRNGGSHYTIERPHGKYPTTIADHGLLKRYNVRDIVKMIDQVKEDK